MLKSLTFTKSFWTSKLGQAAFASIAAMTVMVIVTSQFGAEGASAGDFATTHSPAFMLAEIA